MCVCVLVWTSQKCQSVGRLSVSHCHRVSESVCQSVCTCVSCAACAAGISELHSSRENRQKFNGNKSQVQSVVKDTSTSWKRRQKGNWLRGMLFLLSVFLNSRCHEYSNSELFECVINDVCSFLNNFLLFFSSCWLFSCSFRCMSLFRTVLCMCWLSGWKEVELK